MRRASRGGVPPIVDTPISDRTLTESGGGATTTIDLDDHFFDPNSDEMITYTATSDDEEVVTVMVSGSTLTITAVGTGYGHDHCDAGGCRRAYRCQRPVRCNCCTNGSAKCWRRSFPDRMLYKDDGAVEVILSEYFSHTAEIAYTATSSPEGHVELLIAEGVLTITPLVRGQTIVTVTATAGQQEANRYF